MLHAPVTENRAPAARDREAAARQPGPAWESSTQGNQARLRLARDARPAAQRPSQASLLQRQCACGGVAGLNGKCASCEKRPESTLYRREAGAAVPEAVPAVVNEVLRSPGRPLDAAERAFMEPRFGQQLARTAMCPVTPSRAQTGLAISQAGGIHEREADYLAASVLTTSPAGPGPAYDFSRVRVHTGAKAAESARMIGALAYAAGDSIVFGDQYAPGTGAGRHLLAHELAHVVQQDANLSQVPASIIQRTAASCPADWRATVQDDHNRALGMIDVARGKLSAYDGSTPAEVHTALSTHFHATSKAFAAWVNFNLGFLRLAARLAGYECEDTSSWWCDGSTVAKTLWCVPGFDIRVCQPRYFGRSPIERSETLIHEWVHKYGCNFDLGYKWEPGYATSWTITALLNADPFSEFVKDVQ